MTVSEKQFPLQRSESLLVGSLLALVGGFLDAYTYLSRGKVFANAQTGNMVLLGVRLCERDWTGALGYLVPILAFALGVLAAEWIRKRRRSPERFHWRQAVLAMEIAILVPIAFVPDGAANPYVNTAVSFVCALQVQAFRTMHNLAYATTMCTGNLRSGTERLGQYLATRERAARNDALKYYAVIVLFIAGAAFGVVATSRLSESAVWLPAGILLLVFLLLFERPLRAAEAESDQ